MPPIDWSAHFLYAAAWASFGLGHTVLCAPGIKAHLKPTFGRAYRLAYNLFALIHIAAVIWIARFIVPGTPLDTPPELLFLHGAGWVFLFVALRDYDLGRLSGLAQMRGEADEDGEPLHTGGLHRYVRHPLYLGALMVLWGAVHDERSLATAIWASLYFWAGTVSEERKLSALYGNDYAAYKARVPAVVPWKGKAWP